MIKEIGFFESQIWFPWLRKIKCAKLTLYVPSNKWKSLPKTAPCWAMPLLVLYLTWNFKSTLPIIGMEQSVKKKPEDIASFSFPLDLILEYAFAMDNQLEASMPSGPNYPVLWTVSSPSSTTPRSKNHASVSLESSSFNHPILQPNTISVSQQSKRKILSTRGEASKRAKTGKTGGSEHE